MKNSKFLILIGFLVINAASFGQDYAFRVLASKGTSEVKSGSSWTTVKTGTSLKKEDELKVSENSYVGLVSKEGKPMELKQANTYKVADLLAKVGTGTSVLNKYTDFILSSNSAETKKNRLSATGAVTRSTLLYPITAFMPPNESASVYGNEIIISWATETTKPPYVVTLKNMFDDELLRAETPEQSITINLNDPKLINEAAILLIISPKSDSKVLSEQKLIKRLSAEEHKRIKTELGTDATAETAIGYYMLAGFFEKNKLMLDAATAFEKAVKIEPSYKVEFDDFLLRSGLKPLPKP